VARSGDRPQQLLSWRGQETGHNSFLTDASTTDEHHRCWCRLAGQPYAWHGQWLSNKVHAILGGTPNVATHDMHAPASAAACTLFRDWASEVRRRRVPEMLCPPMIAPTGLPPTAGRGSTQPESHDALFEPQSHFARWRYTYSTARAGLISKAVFGHARVIPAEAGIQTVGHRTPCVTWWRVTPGFRQAGGMGRRRRCISRTGCDDLRRLSRSRVTKKCR